MDSRRLILIVDPQMDFIDGSLPVPGAAECMCALADYIREANDRYVCKVVTTDWHPYNHCSFVEYGGKWPAHCVQNSVGAAVFPPLLSALYSTPGRVAVLRKGTCKGCEEYSIFKNRRSTMQIDRIVRGMMIERIDICGIAGDVCVLDTLRDGTALYGADLFRVLPRFSPSLDGGLLLNDALKSLPE